MAPTMKDSCSRHSWIGARGYASGGRNLMAIIKNIEFKGGFAKLCLMINHSNNGTVFATVYIDDNFYVRNTKALKVFVENLKKQGLTVKVAEKLTNNLRFLRTERAHGLGSFISLQSYKESLANCSTKFRANVLQEPPVRGLLRFRKIG